MLCEVGNLLEIEGLFYRKFSIKHNNYELNQASKWGSEMLMIWVLCAMHV